jgi:hypothetical protein
MENGDAVRRDADGVAREADAVKVKGDASDWIAASCEPSAIRDGRASSQQCRMRCRSLSIRLQVVALMGPADRNATGKGRIRTRSSV